jgi:hypothetical protein
MTCEPTQTKDWSLLFAQYRGQWVALTDDEVTVVAAAPTAKAALATSVAKGVPEPILYLLKRDGLNSRRKLMQPPPLLQWLDQIMLQPRP